MIAESCALVTYLAHPRPICIWWYLVNGHFSAILGWCWLGTFTNLFSPGETIEVHHATLHRVGDLLFSGRLVPHWRRRPFRGLVLWPLVNVDRKLLENHNFEWESKAHCLAHRNRPYTINIVMYPLENQDDYRTSPFTSIYNGKTRYKRPFSIATM